MKYPEFTLLLSSFCDLYGRGATQEYSKLFYSALAEYDLEQVANAFNAHMKNPDGGQYMPTPAHIIREITKPDRLQIEAAWKTVYNGIRDHQHELQDQKTIEVVKNIGGFSKLRTRTEKELQGDQKKFFSLYAREQKTEKQALALSGSQAKELPCG